MDFLSDTLGQNMLGRKISLISFFDIITKHVCACSSASMFTC